jgi:hypothetical protein
MLHKLIFKLSFTLKDIQLKQDKIGKIG